MFKEVKIGDKSVPMLANGSTPIRYRMLFSKDILSEFQAIQNDSTKTETIGELGYVMAMQSKANEGKFDLVKLNTNDYIKWLEQFDPFDIEMAAEDIIGVYIGNMASSSIPKKKEEQ